MYEKKYYSSQIAEYSFLVTGGAGFIGSNLVEYLLKHGAKKVRVLDNFSTGSAGNIEEFKSHSAFELIEGDIRNLDTCYRAAHAVDFISHQAALGSVPRSVNDPYTSNEVNVNGHLNMLLAAKDKGIRRMVYAASSSTYGDHPHLPKVEDKIGNPLSPYAVTKLVNELYASVFSKTYHFHTIGLRYFNVFGPKQSPSGAYAAVIPLFIKAVMANEAAVINGDGETSRDFTYVENVVQANIKALLVQNIKQHEVVNIAYGERTTLNELWKLINELAGTAIQVKYKEERIGDVKHSLANVEKALELINYTPEISIREGLVTTINWFKEFSIKEHSL
jgi:UDP-N-acetylglucosamine 4-epimerase